jgi:hypothetical protein
VHFTARVFPWPSVVAALFSDVVEVFLRMGIFHALLTPLAKASTSEARSWLDREVLPFSPRPYDTIAGSSAEDFPRLVQTPLPYRFEKQNDACSEASTKLAHAMA